MVGTTRAWPPPADYTSAPVEKEVKTRPRTGPHAFPQRTAKVHRKFMLNDLEIQHLRLLDTLYTTGNLSLVAEQRGVSQQALSLQLKKLRQTMADDLFVRSGAGMVATTYTRTIMPQVRQILAGLAAIPAAAQIDVTTAERTLVVSATDYTQRLILTRLIQSLQNYAPRVKIVIVNIESVGLISKMQTGDIDLVFTSHGFVPDGLITQPLLVEKYRCATANRALRNEETQSIEAIARYRFVIASPGNGSLRGSADPWFEAQGLKRTVVASVPTYYAMLELLQHSDLVGFVPARLPLPEGVFDVPLSRYPPGYEVVAAYHDSCRNDQLIAWLITQARAILSTP